MLKTSNINFLNISIRLLILLVSAKLISLFVLWFLPSNGIDFQVTENYKHTYQRVDFKYMFDPAPKKNEEKIYTQESSNNIAGANIGNMVLKGLYGNGVKGFVIVALKSNPRKTSIIAVGEEYKGYKLQSIHNGYVIFTKSSKKYNLQIDLIKPNKGLENSSITSFVKEGSNTNNITRKDIDNYAKNPKKIMEDISIVEVKKNGKIKGFQVKKIKKGSKMAQLGLQKGDLIIKANNIVLTSYKNALDLYSKIDKLDTIQIVIMRNNQEQELVYEIN